MARLGRVSDTIFQSSTERQVPLVAVSYLCLFRAYSRVRTAS